MTQLATKAAGTGAPRAAPSIFNLAHLDALSELITLGGEPALLVYTYCEAPDYRPAGADGEGIAAVDDVARAALVYLDHWAATGRQSSLRQARAALSFVLYMQTPGGGFYNFVLDRAGTINKEGMTSRLSLDWWDCRALWALARGYAIFREIDPAYATRLEAAYQLAERLIARSIGEVGTWTASHGTRVPAWLPNDSAALGALAALALAEYQAIAPNPATAHTLTALADGLAAFHLGGPGVFPWGLHPHSVGGVGFWHAWGSHEAQALARAGAVLRREDWLAAARREVDGFFAWQLATTRLHEFGPLPVVAGQQAYGVNCMVQAAMSLYHATGNPRYARQGGLHASWLLGGNVAGTPVYDPATGRGHDGIDREGDGFLVSCHAGAESTIEALMALQAVLPVPEAARILAYRPVEGTSWAVVTPQEQGQASALMHFTLAREGEYALFVACLRTPGATGPLAVTIDGARSWTWPPIAQPDGAYRWLIPLTPEPLDLSAGTHTLRVEYPDRDRAADGAIAGFLLHPASATRTFLAPDGARLQLHFDLRLGALDWDEWTGVRVGALAGGQ